MISLNYAETDVDRQLLLIFCMVMNDEIQVIENKCLPLRTLEIAEAIPQLRRFPI